MIYVPSGNFQPELWEIRGKRHEPLIIHCVVSFPKIKESVAGTLNVVRGLPRLKYCCQVRKWELLNPVSFREYDWPEANRVFVTAVSPYYPLIELPSELRDSEPEKLFKVFSPDEHVQGLRVHPF